MENRTGNLILIGMVLGAVVGALGGYYLPEIFIELKFLGTIFLNALKMIVVPLIVASMIVGVASLGDISKLGRTSGKTLLYYFATTGISVIIGIILVNVIQPGVGIGGVGNVIPDFVHKAKPAGAEDFIVSLIPDNLISAAADNSILPLIIFSLVFGGVLTAIGRKGRVVIDFFGGLNTAIMKIVIYIIYFAPIGIVGIIGGIVAEKRDSLGEIASGLGLYGLTVIIGLLIHGVIILPLILKFFGKKDPFRYFLNMGHALTTAFTTASSSASLPVTMECVSEKNNVNPKAGSFVLPLGATINMDGTALYEAVAAIFIAQAIGFPLTIEAQVVIFLTATLASIGAAAIPHAGLVTMVIVLEAVGLPLEGIGFIFVIDWFLDRCRTTVNVWGDSVGAAVIGETEEIKSGGYVRKKRQDYGEKRPYKKQQRSDRRENRRDRRNPKDDRGKNYSGTRDRRQQENRSDRRKNSRPDRHQNRPQNQPQDRQRNRSQDKDKPRERYQKDRSDRGRPDKKQNDTNGTTLPPNTIEKELEKVRRQLNELDGKTEPNKELKPERKAVESKRPENKAGDSKKPERKTDDSNKPKPREDKPRPDRHVKIEQETVTESKVDSNEDFFGDLPKFDFFDDKPKAGTKKTEEPVYMPFPEEKEKSPKEPDNKADSKPEKPETNEESKPAKPATDIPKPERPKTDSEPARDEESGSDEDDLWGRDKKKRSRR